MQQAQIQTLCMHMKPCLYYKRSVILLAQFNNCILVGPKQKEIDEAISRLKESKQNFTIKDEGDIADFFRANIE